MLPRHLRLKHPRDFQAVRDHGRRWRGSLFTLSTLPNQLPHNRFGFVIGRRQMPTAVARNRGKRQMREAVRRLLPNLSSGYDFVLVGRSELASASFQMIVEALDVAFSKTGLRSSAPDKDSLI
jgi:ribonuclease P protein component